MMRALRIVAPVLVMGAALLAAPPPAGAQGGAPAARGTAWRHPMTPWGDPDLQGVWSSGAMSGVPFERPRSFGTRASLTDEELKQREQQLAAAYERFVIGQYGEAGRRPQRQASLIVDPPDGRLPAITPAAQARMGSLGSSRQDRPFNGPEDFDTWDRCITRGLLSSMVPAMYGNVTGIVQGPGYVVIRNEMVHEARVVPLDGRPHIGRAITSWMGDSRARWEGRTLVVETRNFNGRTVAINAGTPGTPRDNNVPTSTSLRIVERFTREGDARLRYEATVEDPEVFARPFTVSLAYEPDEAGEVYEYACHENNYALRNILSAARAAERP